MALYNRDRLIEDHGFAIVMYESHSLICFTEGVDNDEVQQCSKND